ncbi:unnamed protein product [Spirodela intermedia]|uniref:Uncharacterized protein n=1 Tax=Spirodela intermedia TaxID=51605 RepID=A0A7I8INT7_SPIIN|nr:unnamed protein product [Spirodela intermedia]CAA6658657.1 unnamed protein product [Spirodela intermedia]
MALVCSTGGGSCCLQRAQVRGVAPSSGPIPLLSNSWRRMEEELGGEVDDSLPSSAEGELLGTDGASSVSTPIPDLPGLTTDFWEGSKWDTFGFIVQYLWAFGIVFALIACGIAVATYNEGATDFKETPVFKESMQSQELLEEPDSSGSDVFEVNPTEVAPNCWPTFWPTIMICLLEILLFNLLIFQDSLQMIRDALVLVNRV